MNFWDVVKEVSAQPVQKEASRLFVLALAGSEESVAAARAVALGPSLSPETAAQAEPYLFTASPPYSEADETRLRHADLLVSLPGGPGITEFRPADALMLARVEELVPAVLARREDLRVALGRRLPGFRTEAAEQVIRRISWVNAEFSTIAGISN